jgi:hypothetical protein
MKDSESRSVKTGFDFKGISKFSQSVKASMSHNHYFFIFVFLATAFTSRPAGGSSSGGVEQWFNLTNSMFSSQQDFIFSYGPLYWITGGASAPYSSVTFVLSIVFIALTQASFWTAIWLAAKDRLGFYLVPAFFTLVASQGLLPSAALYIWPVLILPQLSRLFSKSPDAAKSLAIALGASVGFLFYVRFYFGLIAALAFFGWMFVRFVQTRRPGLIVSAAIAAILTYLLVGLAIFKNQKSLLDYLLINSQLSFGNAVDMTFEVQTNWIVFAALCFVVLITAWFVRGNPEILVPLILVEFVLFKLGFGRADHVATHLIPPLAAILLVITPKLLSPRIFSPQVLASLLIVFAGLTPNFVGGPKLQLSTDLDSTQEDYEIRMAGKYQNFLLDEVTIKKIGSATVDVYPYYNEIVFANGLNYRHRPLFQSYMTLTPALGERNRDFFESTEAPEFVLWTGGAPCNDANCDIFQAFDGKYLLNEDPITVRSIMDHYKLESKTSLPNGVPVLVLRKSEPKEFKTKQFQSSGSGQLGEWIQVPSKLKTGVVLVPELKFTVTGSMKNTLFRGNSASITYTLANGETRTHRLNILNANAGVWASPLLIGSTFEGSQVTALKIDAPSWYLQRVFAFSWLEQDLAAMTYQ